MALRRKFVPNENPLFSGAVGVWDGMVLYDWDSRHNKRKPPRWRLKYRAYWMVAPEWVRAKNFFGKQ